MTMKMTCRCLGEDMKKDKVKDRNLNTNKEIYDKNICKDSQ